MLFIFNFEFFNFSLAAVHFRRIVPSFKVFNIDTSLRHFLRSIINNLRSQLALSDLFLKFIFFTSSHFYYDPFNDMT